MVEIRHGTGITPERLRRGAVRCPRLPCNDASVLPDVNRHPLCQPGSVIPNARASAVVRNFISVAVCGEGPAAAKPW